MCTDCNSVTLPSGINGDNGWSPELSLVSADCEGPISIIRLIKWIGGTGSKPFFGANEMTDSWLDTNPIYIGTTGFVTDPCDATNVNGSAGSVGPQGPIGPQGATGPQGPAGLNGTNGVDGKTILNGTINPGSGIGSNGDFYLNTSTFTLFGPKTAGTWPTPGTPLIGPQGPAGPPGPTGPIGPQGVPGTLANAFYQYVADEGNVLPQKNVLNFIGDLVTASNSLSTTDVVINNKIHYCELVINNIYQPESGLIPRSTTLPLSNKTIARDGQYIKKYTRIVSQCNNVLATPTAGNYVSTPPFCSFGTMNNDTGIFTITEPGLYFIQASVHLSPDNNTSQYWLNPGQDVMTINGEIGLGIVTDNNSDIYAGNFQTISGDNSKVITTDVDITTSTIMFNPSGSSNKPIAIKILNKTNRDYNGKTYTSSNVIRFAIIKIFGCTTGFNNTSQSLPNNEEDQN